MTITEDYELNAYIPDGHLQGLVIKLLEGAGFEPEIKDRAYGLQTNSDTWNFKVKRPQDQPHSIANGNAVLGVSGEDILEEFRLGYPDLSDNVEVLQSLPGKQTKLVAVVPKKGFEKVYNLKKFFDTYGTDATMASEYPNIVKNYVEKNFGVSVKVYEPKGKTEAMLIGKNPEVNIIFDTTETGTTIRANKCKIIGTLMKSDPVIIANSEAYRMPPVKEEIDNLLEQFNGVLRARTRNLQRLEINVFDEKKVKPIAEYLIRIGYRPSVSQIYTGNGADIYVVIPNNKVKNITPELNKLGGTDMIVSEVSRVLYPIKK